jgi:hypothetical protein
MPSPYAPIVVEQPPSQPVYPVQQQQQQAVPVPQLSKTVTTTTTTTTVFLRRKPVVTVPLPRVDGWGA